MGYVVDPLLFRLKIVKFWFSIGYSNKKFYNYIISFQSYFVTFITTFMGKDQRLNELKIYFSSVRLIQVFNNIYILLLIRFYYEKVVKSNYIFWMKTWKKKNFYVKKINLALFI